MEEKFILRQDEINDALTSLNKREMESAESARFFCRAQELFQKLISVNNRLLTEIKDLKEGNGKLQAEIDVLKKKYEPEPKNSSTKTEK